MKSGPTPSYRWIIAGILWLAHAISFMGNLLCPPLFGFLVDGSGSYACAWLFLAGCSAAALLLLACYVEPDEK